MVPPFRHPPAHRFLHIDIDVWCDMCGVPSAVTVIYVAELEDAAPRAVAPAHVPAKPTTGQADTRSSGTNRGAAPLGRAG
jgi:hypothetical protein